MDDERRILPSSLINAFTRFSGYFSMMDKMDEISWIYFVQA